MILILGCNGFIGQHLTKYIIKSNKYQKILGVGRKEQFAFKHKNFEYLSLDICNHNLLSFSRYNIDTILVLASDASTNKIIKKELKKQYDNNVLITKNTLRLCKILKPKTFIYFSSVYAYTESNNYLNEKLLCKPKNILGKSKISSENIIKNEYHNYKQTKFIILRLFTVYGKNMRKEQFLYEAIRKIKNKNKKITFYNPETFRNFIHVNDVCRLCYKLINFKKLAKYQIFNIASNKSYKIKKIVSILLEFSKKQKKINYISGKNNYSHFANINSIKKKFGKIRFVNIKKGIKELF